MKALSGISSRAAKFDWFLLLLPVLGIAAMSLVLLREATYGVALTWDSATHIAAIRSLLDGNGFGAFNGVVYQPILGPMLPLAAAFVGLFGVEATQAAATVNAAAFGLTVAITAWWLKHRVQSRLLVVWAACACALTTGLASLAARVLSDILFTACVAASLFALDRFTANGRRVVLVAAAACAAAACLTRPVGVTLVASGLLVLLLRRGREGGPLASKEKIGDAAIWLCVVGLPLLLWALRGVFLMAAGEGVFMMHWGVGFSLPNSLHAATTEVARWIYTDVGLNFLSVLLERSAGVSLAHDLSAFTLLLKGLLLAAPATALALALAWRRPGAIGRNRDTFLVCVAFLSAYVLFIAVVLPSVNLNLAGRYLRPLLPPVLVLVTVALAEIASGRRSAASTAATARPTGNAVRALVLVGAFAWLAPQMRANYDDIDKWNTIGFGYGRKQAIESEVLHHLRASPPADRLVSNDEPGFYFWMDRTENVDGMTKQFQRLESAIANALAAREKIIVAVFHGSFWKRNYDYDLGDLADLPGLHVAAFLEDGIVLASDANSQPSAANATTPDDFGERALQALAGSGRRVARSQLDLYFNPDSRRLVYVREDCGDGNWPYVGRHLFLHIHPVSRAALPERRQEAGFEAMDFRFDSYGGTFGNRCIASRTLPAYDIATVKTGQNTLLGGDQNWTAEISLNVGGPPPPQ